MHNLLNLLFYYYMIVKMLVTGNYLSVKHAYKLGGKLCDI